MDTLINELTLYSKIDTNRIPYDFAKLNVAAYFKDCVEEIGLDLEAKGIALSYFNYATPDTQIIADPEQLRRVINNIIGNSVKYMNKTEKSPTSLIRMLMNFSVLFIYFTEFPIILLITLRSCSGSAIIWVSGVA